jgi:hypothetical protein
MKITLSDPSGLESLLMYLRANGCVAYTDDQPWTITAVPHAGLDKRAVVRLIAAWTASDQRGHFALDELV